MFERLSGIEEAASTVLSGLVALVREVVLLAVTLVWIVFWGLVIGQHFENGDLSGAIATAAIMILPALGFVAWHVSHVAGLDGLDLPTPGWT